MRYGSGNSGLAPSVVLPWYLQFTGQARRMTERRRLDSSIAGGAAATVSAASADMVKDSSEAGHVPHYGKRGFVRVVARRL
jgi:hypothetical protein